MPNCIFDSLDLSSRTASDTSTTALSKHTRYIVFFFLLPITISSPSLLFQSIFLFCGCLTIACTPFVYFLPDSPATAKFLEGDDRVKAIERLRDNNMGTEAKVWKWEQFWETFRDPKSYLWFALLFLAAYVFTLVCDVQMTGLI